MLFGDTIRQLTLIKGSLTFLVEKSVDAYEAQFSPISTKLEKQKAIDSTYGVVKTVITRIEEEKPMSIFPIYPQISSALVVNNFDVQLFVSILVAFKNVVPEYIFQATDRSNTTTERFISLYIDKIVQAVSSLDIFTKGLTSDQLIQLISPYAPSKTLVEQRLLVDKKGPFDGVNYTIIKRNKYWEEQLKEISNSGGRIGSFNQTIYKGKLYNLNKGITRVSREFSNNEWTENVPRLLKKENTFNNRLKANIESYVTQALTVSETINQSISDSQIQKIESYLQYTEKDLLNSFAGKGRDVIDNIISLKTVCYYFGNNEASPVGSVDYTASFYEYIYSCCYGRVLEDGFTNVDGITLFGKFNELFFYGNVENKIAGLAFLDEFSKLKSFNHRQKIYDTFKDIFEDDSIEKENIKGDIYFATIKHNPIYTRYISGLEDRFEFDVKNPYVDNYELNADVILFGIETIYNISSNLGGLLSAVQSTLSKGGLLPGYEGLGPISIQIEELSKIFLGRNEIEYLSVNNKVLPGLSGLSKYLLTSYQKLIAVAPDVSFTGESLRRISEWGRRIQGSLEAILSEIEGIGYLPGSFIPNISFKSFSADRENLIDQLRSLNFQESEINQFLSCETFEELLLKFSPITDSRDQTSFFKAYELAQLIYEFGGESAIDSYISYLYSNKEDNLISLLNFTLKNQTRASTYNSQRFAKLIGLLINLTHAVNPDQLDRFKEFLEGNRLTFFESISYLINNKEANILLDKEEISLLKPVTDSLIYGKSPFGLDANSIDYETAYKEAPAALKQWTQTLDENLGNASTSLIQNLYDKSSGLTTKELLLILNPSSFHNELGQIIDGYEGGRLTKFMNYAYLSGLLYKIGYYNNSYQTPNFFVSGRGGVNLTMLVETVRALAQSIDITLTNFVNNISDPLPLASETRYSFQNIQNSYNKKLIDISTLIKNLVPLEGDIKNINYPTISGNSDILSPPGMGNSPVPQAITREGTLSPEQANQLSSEIAINFSFKAPLNEKDNTSNDTIRKFIKYVDKNKEILGSPLRNNYVSKASDALVPGTIPTSSGQEPTGFERDIDIIDLRPFLPNEIIDNIENKVVDNLVLTDLLENFSPVEFCKRFGGVDCEERYTDIENPCSELTNRSIYPEEDLTDITPVLPSSIPIDRASGRNSENKLPNAFIPSKGNGNKPVWFDLFSNLEDTESLAGLENIIPPGSTTVPLTTITTTAPTSTTTTPTSTATTTTPTTTLSQGTSPTTTLSTTPTTNGLNGLAGTSTANELQEFSVKIGVNGEPILSKIYENPIIFKESDINNQYNALYYNSSMGLIESIKAKYEKDEPFKCSLLEDAYAYLACMNLLKCKKFKTTNNVTHLKFCPKTLAGGLNK